MCRQFMALIHNPLTEISPTGQNTSNLLWAASILDIRLHATMLDRLGAYLVHLTQQPSTKATVTAQQVSNTLWSFHKMRHSPNLAHLSSLLAHFNSLFAIPSRQPTSHNICNVVLAVAGLNFEQSRHTAKDLAHRLLVTDRADMVAQQLCNTVWSLAVLNVLDMATFKLFWSIILSRYHGIVSVPHVTQLYQALYKLQPSSNDLAWQQLRQEVTATLGPLRLTPSQRSPALHNVLQALQLEHSQDVVLSGYTAEAVLKRKAKSDRDVLLVILSAESRLTNDPDR